MAPYGNVVQEHDGTKIENGLVGKQRTFQVQSTQEAEENVLALLGSRLWTDYAKTEAIASPAKPTERFGDSLPRFSRNDLRLNKLDHSKMRPKC